MATPHGTACDTFPYRYTDGALAEITQVVDAITGEVHDITKQEVSLHGAFLGGVGVGCIRVVYLTKCGSTYKVSRL